MTVTSMVQGVYSEYLPEKSEWAEVGVISFSGQHDRDFVLWDLN